MLKGINDLELECIENAISLETISNTNTVKVNIPKLMPLIDVGVPLKKHVIINRNILINDMSSIPQLDFRVETSNYIELSINNGNVEKGDSLLVLIPNKNIKKMRVIDL